ncbi:polyhydroxyalkanoic acid system family protein [Pseudenhygromyxa sp. WMMC2535]|uniref:polyhydroxyalkanoic acid system family protein n=1 Tax=Pseudenhygromyxa sp. WMMC2535 TaxID=2712867 RepID=UPI0015543C95|nr:polyhydroxyalkanoic acid system family protein [Pseudenhygromyxa sp. WMMC2535]
MKTHDIPHDLDIDLAKLAARKAAEAYGERFAEYDYKATWVSDTRVELGFTVMGKRLEGAMTVMPRKLALELDVPLLFRPFQGKAIEIIEREARGWLDRAKRGELTGS